MPQGNDAPFRSGVSRLMRACRQILVQRKQPRECVITNLAPKCVAPDLAGGGGLRRCESQSPHLVIVANLGRAPQFESRAHFVLAASNGTEGAPLTS